MDKFDIYEISNAEGFVRYEAVWFFAFGVLNGAVYAWAWFSWVRDLL